MPYTVLIALHAIAGLVAFAAGIGALSRARFFPLYRWSLRTMAAFLVLAIAVAATDRDAGDWAVSGALIGLAAVMLLRAEQARRALPAGHTGGPTAAYVNGIGFGLVGLFDAFWVVTLLRLNTPIWAAATLAIAIALTGHLLLVRTTRQQARAMPRQRQFNDDQPAGRPRA